LIGALGGVSVGAVAETLRASAAFKREKRWTFGEERRQHLEQAYECLEQFREVYGTWYVNTMHSMAFSTPSSLKASERAVPWARLQMLVDFYLPELRSRLRKIQEVGPALGTALAEAPTRPVHAAEQLKSSLVPLDRAYNDLNSAVDAMRDQIVALSNAIQLEKAKSSGK
jgi:hypothetical protein